MPYAHFEVQMLDAHVINTNFIAEGGRKAHEKEKSMSIVVVVSGSVRVEEKGTGPLRQFSETFTLVPNTEKRGKGGWRVQMQNFRYVV